MPLSRKRIFSELPEHSLFAGNLCIAAGLSWSHFLLSVGTLLIALSFLMAGNYKDSLRSYCRDPLAVLCLMLLLVSLLSFFNSSEKTGWWNDVRIKLPFLLIPLGFCAVTFRSKRHHYYVLLTFLITVAVITLLSMFNFAMNYEQLSTALLQAKPIPVTGGISHIYFGLQMAFAVFAAWYLHGELREKLSRPRHVILILLGLIPFAGLHVLSSRTGLMVFYLAALIAGGRELLLRKKYGYALLLLIILLLTPVVTYNLFSSFRNKVTNTLEDLRTYTEGSNRNFHSISTRLESLEVAFDLFRDNPVAGVGIGDLPIEMENRYESNGSWLTPENRILPHNEFFYYLAAFGLTGTLVLLVLIFYPIFIKRYRRQFLFLPFWVVIFTGMLVEALFERQIGVAFFTFFIMFITRTGEKSYPEKR